MQLLRKRTIFAAIIMALSCCSLMAARPTVKMTIDSAAILMGYTVDLHVTVKNATNSENARIILRPDSSGLANSGQIMQLIQGVEVVEGYEDPKLETPSGDNNTGILQSTIKIQSFDSGNYIIPPVAYVSGHDTVLSNSVALRVFPVDTITADSDLMPMSSIMPAYDRKFVDYLPDWLVDNWVYFVIGLIIIIGGICAYLILTKKVKLNILPQKKPEPPYNVAIAKLEKLREEQLCEIGMQKEYYTRLTDILREYLERRFGINAMEMTSTQIRRSLNQPGKEIMSKELVEQVLEIADFVKFAKAKPLGDDNIRAFESARQFVEDTKPAEATDENSEIKVNN